MHSTHPAHLISRFDKPNIWSEVQTMKLLIMQFSPVSCHFLPLTAKTLPQVRPVTERMIPDFSQMKRTASTSVMRILMFAVSDSIRNKEDSKSECEQATRQSECATRRGGGSRVRFTVGSVETLK